MKKYSVQTSVFIHLHKVLTKKNHRLLHIHIRNSYTFRYISCHIYYWKSTFLLFPTKVHSALPSAASAFLFFVRAPLDACFVPPVFSPAKHLCLS